MRLRNKIFSFTLLGLSSLSILIGSGYATFVFQGTGEDHRDILARPVLNSVTYPEHKITRAVNRGDIPLIQNVGEGNLDSDNAGNFAPSIGGGNYTVGRSRWNKFQNYLPSSLVVGTKKQFKINVTDENGNALTVDEAKNMDIRIFCESNGINDANLYLEKTADPFTFNLGTTDDAPSDSQITFYLYDAKVIQGSANSNRQEIINSSVAFNVHLYSNQSDLIYNTSEGNFDVLGTQGKVGKRHGKDKKFELFGKTVWLNRAWYWYDPSYWKLVHRGNGVNADNKDPNGRNIMIQSKMDLGNAETGSVVDIDGKYSPAGSNGKEITISNTEVGAGTNKSELTGGGSYDLYNTGGTILYVSSNWGDNFTNSDLDFNINFFCAAF